MNFVPKCLIAALLIMMVVVNLAHNNAVNGDIIGFTEIFPDKANCIAGSGDGLASGRYYEKLSSCTPSNNTCTPYEFDSSMYTRYYCLDSFPEFEASPSFGETAWAEYSDRMTCSRLSSLFFFLHGECVTPDGKGFYRVDKQCNTLQKFSASKCADKDQVDFLKLEDYKNLCHTTATTGSQYKCAINSLESNTSQLSISFVLIALCFVMQFIL